MTERLLDEFKDTEAPIECNSYCASEGTRLTQLLKQKLYTPLAVESREDAHLTSTIFVQIANASLTKSRQYSRSVGIIRDSLRTS